MHVARQPAGDLCCSSAAYNASGGAGIAETQDLGDGRMHVTFDAQTLYIPDVYSKTAKFLGAPLVPPFRIRIEPVKLEVMMTCPANATTVAALQGFLSAAYQSKSMPAGSDK